jgi:site-specific DNA-methyltransferase (adenine-specific)
MELNMVYNEDCLIGMKNIPDGGVDMILCDLPYGTTACAWDTIIPFEPLWEQYKRVIKDNGAIVLTASQPFTSKVVSSNYEMFKHEWIWDKKKPSTFLTAKIEPLRKHESVLVFCDGKVKYNPIKTKGRFRNKTPTRKGKDGAFGKYKGNDIETFNDEQYPKSIIEISGADQTDKFHPTQKPVPLFEYLIKTYTNENETVLDNCMGSGTTAIACLNTKRNFIGYEMDKEYFDKATKRIKEHKNALECNVGLFSNEVQKQLSLL